VVAAGAEGTLASVPERLRGDVQVVDRVVLPDERGFLATVLTVRRPEVLLVETPLADLDFDVLRLCAERRIRVLALCRPPYGFAYRGRIVRLGGLPWMPVRPLRIGPLQAFAKRALDLALVLLAAPVLLPLLAVLAAAIAATSPGGVFYRQTRLGQDGRPFVLRKFRTMVVGAEDESGPVLSEPHDPRVTRVGRRLRRLHLDELPQLWNVLRGDMSLVGPRPERPELADRLWVVPGAGCRHVLKPGLTGLAQLVGGYRASPEDKVRCDLVYLSAWSLRLDLRLVGLTLLDFLRGFPDG
jgi:lipopolysaccharide/colanic/teichoic acid biosynthesis glycosyltransferase